MSNFQQLQIWEPLKNKGFPGSAAGAIYAAGARNREQLQRDPLPEICSHRQQDPEPGAGTGCSGIHQLMICSGIREPGREISSGRGNISQSAHLLATFSKRRKCFLAGSGTGNSCSGIHQLMICSGIRSGSRAARTGKNGSQVPETAAAGAISGSHGAKIDNQSGRKDKQTDKRPQAAGTGRIRANYSSCSGILCRDPGARAGNWLQRVPFSGSRVPEICSGIHQLMICIRIRSRVPEF